jgi:hypothetical protein
MDRRRADYLGLDFYDPVFWRLSIPAFPGLELFYCAVGRGRRALRVDRQATSPRLEIQ